MRADPVAGSLALVRVFVGNLLSAHGAADEDVEDVKVVVSDLATLLVQAGHPIEIRASFHGAGLELSGNSAGEAPSSALLGTRLDLGEGHWTIKL